MALEAIGSNPIIHPTYFFTSALVLETWRASNIIWALFAHIFLVCIQGCSQAVRHRTLTATFVGSSPAIPAIIMHCFDVKTVHYFFSTTWQMLLEKLKNIEEIRILNSKFHCIENADFTSLDRLNF